MKPEMMIVSIIVLAAAWIDWNSRRIPNWLTGYSILAGLLFHGWSAGLSGLGMSLLGVAAGMATLIAPFLLRAMGAGDVKLMMAVGAWLGPVETFHAFLWIALYGGAIGLIVLAFGGRLAGFYRDLKTWLQQTLLLQQLQPVTITSKPSRKMVLPYGIPIALGVVTVLTVGG